MHHGVRNRGSAIVPMIWASDACERRQGCMEESQVMCNDMHLASSCGAWPSPRFECRVSSICFVFVMISSIWSSACGCSCRYTCIYQIANIHPVDMRHHVLACVSSNDSHSSSKSDSTSIRRRHRQGNILSLGTDRLELRIRRKREPRKRLNDANDSIGGF